MLLMLMMIISDHNCNDDDYDGNDDENNEYDDVNDVDYNYDNRDVHNENDNGDSYIVHHQIIKYRLKLNLNTGQPYVCLSDSLSVCSHGDVNACANHTLHNVIVKPY